MQVKEIVEPSSCWLMLEGRVSRRNGSTEILYGEAVFSFHSSSTGDDDEYVLIGRYSIPSHVMKPETITILIHVHSSVFAVVAIRNSNNFKKKMFCT